MQQLATSSTTLPSLVHSTATHCGWVAEVGSVEGRALEVNRIADDVSTVVNGAITEQSGVREPTFSSHLTTDRGGVEGFADAQRDSIVQIGQEVRDKIWQQA